MDLSNRVSYYLEPGYIYFSKMPAIVRTVLGSCVAVSLWDRQRLCGGVNHFVHPWTREPGTATPQFGNVATAALIKIMEDAGCQREDMVAQVTGGGRPQDSEGPDVGTSNVQVARDILMRKGISIASEDVGGIMGRKIVFDTYTGNLVVLKVHSIRSTDWKFEY